MDVEGSERLSIDVARACHRVGESSDALVVDIAAELGVCSEIANISISCGSRHLLGNNSGRANSG